MPGFTCGLLLFEILVVCVWLMGGVVKMGGREVEQIVTFVSGGGCVVVVGGVFLHDCGDGDGLCETCHHFVDAAV